MIKIPKNFIQLQFSTNNAYKLYDITQFCNNFFRDRFTKSKGKPLDPNPKKFFFSSDAFELTSEDINDCNVIGDYYVGQKNGKTASWFKNPTKKLVEFSKSAFEYEISENEKIGTRATPTDGVKLRIDFFEII